MAWKGGELTQKNWAEMFAQVQAKGADPAWEEELFSRHCGLQKVATVHNVFSSTPTPRIALGFEAPDFFFRDGKQPPRDLLRGLTYLQSTNGNVVLWMQPDGTLNPSAEPIELPDPSDSGPSYWLARPDPASRRGARALCPGQARGGVFAAAQALLELAETGRN